MKTKVLRLNNFKLKTGLLLLLISFSNLLNGQTYSNPGCDLNTAAVVTLTPTAAWQTVTDANDAAVTACKWYKFTAVMGHKYTFQTGCGQGGVCTGNSWLDITDSYGIVISDNDNSSCADPNPLSSQLIFIAPSNGDFYCIVEEYGFGNMNYTLAYNVEDCIISSDFTSSVAGNIVTFTDASTGGTPSSWGWDFGDGGTAVTQSPQHTYTCPGTYNVTLVTHDMNGCRSEKSHEVTIAGGSTASFTHTDNANTINFTSTSTGTITGYAWDFDFNSNTSTAQSPSFTYTCSGWYHVRLIITDNNSCQDTTYDYVQATGDPQADFTISSVSGQTVSFSDQSHGTNLTYLWDFGDGTTDTIQNPSHTYACPGEYAIILTVGSIGGCTSYPRYSYVNIIGEPTSSFYYTTSGTTVTLVNTSTGTITGYLWNFDDGSGTSTAPNPTHTFACPGGYYVQLTSTTATCSNTTGNYIQVYGDPTASFTYSSTGTTVNFNNTSSGTSLSYDWSIYESGYGYTNYTTQNPSHTFHCGGDHYVHLSVTNLTSCSSNYSSQVHIDGDPNPLFIPNVSGNTVNFSNATTGTVATYSWNFGDATVSNAAAPTHIYSCPGEYSVDLTTTGTNGCEVSTQQTIYIAGSPASNFTYTGSADTINFTSTSTGANLTYLWYFGDGTQSTLQNPVHIYDCGGSQYVSLMVTDSTCSSDTSITIEVVSDPYASFTFDVQGTNVNFTSTAIGIITQTFWSFHNSDYTFSNYSFLPNPVETFTTCETIYFYQSVTNGNGCYDYIEDSISIPYTAVTHNHDTITADANGASYQWVDCNNNYLPVVPAQTGQSFLAAANGDYAVIITAGSCSDTSECINVLTVGIGQNNFEPTIKIFPNPSNNRFNLQTAFKGQAEISVIDLVGRVVYKKELSANGEITQVIDLSDQSNGVYTMKLQMANGRVLIRKLIKQ